MILPKVRDPRFITIRRGGTLTDRDHHLLAEWAAACAEHVVHHFEAAAPSDLRPRHAIEQVQGWARGEVPFLEVSAAADGESESAGQLECRWQRDQLPDEIRELVVDDQRLRNEICWSAFDC